MVVNAPLLGTSGGAICAPNLRSQTIPNVADGAYRFHWSVIPSEESLPIAAGRTGGLARARSIAEATLQADAEDWRGLLRAETEAVVSTLDHTR